MSDLCVGIDLGTTNSLVGAVIDGKVRLFPDGGGNDLLPSAVGVDGAGKLLVGRLAKNQRLIDPAGTSVSVKRKMGSTEQVRVGAKKLSPPQVSALILGALLDRVEAALGKRPTRAVITVPAFFSDIQRQATKDAGALAGLTVERLVNEPTAAAMTYQTGAEQTVMVYDLGGGTFDVSILERDEGFLEVRASRGDTRLGGDDVDAGLVELVLSRLGDDRERVSRDARAMTRLSEAVERAKMALSERDEHRLLEPFLTGEGAGAVQLELLLTRADVDQVARPLIERTLRCIDEALADAKLKPEALDRVLLVGGASRSPIVREMVSAHLRRPVLQDLDADRAVALGASLIAGRASGADVNEVLVDITPHTLAAGVLSEYHLENGPPLSDDDLTAAPVIPRNTVIPVERHQIVYTMMVDQETCSLPIVQGEAEFVGGNTMLGVVKVTDLPPSPANSPVEVAFKLDLSGVLHVTARHVPSGRSAQVTIANGPYQLTAQRRDEARRELDALRARVADGAAVEPEASRPAAAGPAAKADPRRSEAATTRARSLLTKADKALASQPPSGALSTVGRARAALAAALDAGGDIDEATDALADALLDLV